MSESNKQSAMEKQYWQAVDSIKELKSELTNYKLGFATANEDIEKLQAKLDTVKGLKRYL